LDDLDTWRMNVVCQFVISEVGRCVFELANTLIKNLLNLLTLAAISAIGIVGLMFYRNHTQQAQTIVELKQQTTELKNVVTRLSSERRVAEIVVTDQWRMDDKLHTTLLFVETDRVGKPLPPRSFTVVGENVHLSARVIKFKQNFLETGDALKGQSISLFHSIYGDDEMPAKAQRIDKPGRVPDLYRDASPAISAFELSLWDQFWKLIEDPIFRDENGVDVVQGTTVWGPFRAGHRYEATLSTGGALLIRDTPMPDIYRAALNRQSLR